MTLTDKHTHVAQLYAHILVVWISFKTYFNMITNLQKSFKTTKGIPVDSPDSQIVYILHHLLYHSPSDIYLFEHMHAFMHLYVCISCPNHLKLNCYRYRRQLCPLPLKTFVCTF